MLHIHNGDASADTAKQSSIPGEHFAFREALITGPIQRGLSRSEWQDVRANYLSASYDVPPERCQQELALQEQKLTTARDHDEVVLWFEHDLFCQVHLIYLLNSFKENQRRPQKLTMICIGEFPGRPNFKGLGELTSDEFASLFPSRQPVTTEQFNLASNAWNAYSASAPTEIEKLLRDGTRSLPFLDSALRAHLRRFPFTSNGIGAVESTALRLVQSGIQSFADLFTRFGEAQPAYGFGDAQVWLALKRLADARHPLLEQEENAGKTLSAEIMPEAKFALTELGESVLAGTEDFVKLNGIDLWLGGVHLEGRDASWRWDESSGKIIAW